MYPPRSRTFRAPKALEQLPDCQDAIYPLPGFGEGGTVFAVADGSTSSFYAARWAELLADGFAEATEQAFADWHLWLEPLREDWLLAVRSRLDAKSTLAPDIRLIFENNLKDGKDAGATFAGIEFFPPEGDGSVAWRALAVGDACLFHLRADAVDSLPIDDAAKFDFQTVAISSLEMAPEPQIFQGTSDREEAQPPARVGDIFILATDEMAKWMLKNSTRKPSPTPVWGEILALAEEGLSVEESERRFHRLVERARNHQTQPLGNDDVALGVIVFGQPHSRYVGAAGGLLSSQVESAEVPAVPVQPASLRPPQRSSSPPETEAAQELPRAPDTLSAPRDEAPRSKPTVRRQVGRWIGAVLMLVAVFLTWRVIASLWSEGQSLRGENEDLKSQLAQALAASRSLEQAPQYQKILGEREQFRERNNQLERQKTIWLKEQEKLAGSLKQVTAERDDLKRLVEKLNAEKRDLEAPAPSHSRGGSPNEITPPPDSSVGAGDSPSAPGAAPLRRVPTAGGARLPTPIPTERPATPHAKKRPAAVPDPR
jgi:hypothetical protein